MKIQRPFCVLFVSFMFLTLLACLIFNRWSKIQTQLFSMRQMGPSGKNGRSRYSGQSDTSKKPNILLIVADDYGWHDIGYHGSGIRTPNMDKLASEGVKLENYYVQPICTPSRSQLLSGRHQIHTGLQHLYIIPEQPNGLNLSLPTVADKLRETGYATHMVGKWHLGFFKKEYTPIYRGFDSFFGHYLGSHDYFSHFLGKGIDLMDNMDVAYNYTGQYSTQLFTRKAQEIAVNHDKSKPLFLFLSYQAVHSPLQVPKHYKEPYSHFGDNGRESYAGMVTCMDEGVGNVTQTFKDHGLWENTILIFTTDNGGEVICGANNYPLRGAKTTLWEGGIRGVAFVNSPLMQPMNTTCKELMHISDWFPTFLHLANYTGPALELDGFNQWETISNGKSSPRSEILHNIDPLWGPKGKSLFPHVFDTRVHSAIRLGDWKLLTGNPGRPFWQHPPEWKTNWTKNQENIAENKTKNLWLFNIREDPTEHNDLSQTHPDMVQLLLQRLKYHNSTAVPVTFPPKDSQAVPELHNNVWISWKD